MQEGGCVTTPSKTPHPTPVPSEATPVGTVRDRWSWAEPSVWTDRLLTALESGVTGGKPTAFFAERGLLSLCAAYASELRQSFRR